MSHKTSSATNPKPNTWIRVSSTRGFSEYVFIGNYRIKHTRRGWYLYIARGADWQKPRFFPTRQAAADAMAVHEATGKIPDGATPSTEQRLTAVERRLDQLERDTGFGASGTSWPEGRSLLDPKDPPT